MCKGARNGTRDMCANDNVTCPQRKTLRSVTENVTTSTSTVLRGSASSSSIKANPLTTMIAPRVLPQADPKAKPTTPGPLMNKYAPRRLPQPPAKPEPEDEGDSFEIKEQDDGLSWTGPEPDFEDDGLSSAQSRSVSDPLPVPPSPLPKPPLEPTPEQVKESTLFQRSLDPRNFLRKQWSDHDYRDLQCEHKTLGRTCSECKNDFVPAEIQRAVERDVQEQRELVNSYRW